MDLVRAWGRQGVHLGELFPDPYAQGIIAEGAHKPVARGMRKRQPIVMKVQKVQHEKGCQSKLQIRVSSRYQFITRSRWVAVERLEKLISPGSSMPTSATDHLWESLHCMWKMVIVM